MARPPQDAAKPQPPDGPITVYPLPKKNFDPARASDRTLKRLGLPTAMAFSDNPAAAAFRQDFLRRRPDANPLSFLPALKRTTAAPPSGLIGTAAQASWPVQKSMNWSGGYVTPRDGRSFVSVMAHWTVPEVFRPAGATTQEYVSSTWIGLDGQKFYLDSSLPQIGTRQRWPKGAKRRAEYSSWFQWWARGLDLPILDLALPVDPYDEISAIITVLDEETVRCNLKNVSKGIILQAFKASVPAGLRISGATAEWVMERPSPMGSDGWEPYELPVYTPFAFTGCVAESAAPEIPDLRQHDLENARLIRMYEINHAPTSVPTISTARRNLEPPEQLELTYVSP